MEERRRPEKKEIIIICSLLFALVGLIFFPLIFREEERAPTPKTRVYFDYFNTESRYIDYSGSSEEDFQRAASLVGEKLKFYHELFDIYHEYEGITNLKTLNNHAGEGPVQISEELFDLLEYSKEMYTLTGGEVNIAMGAVLSIWHEYREAGVALPERALLLEAAEHTDIEKLRLDRENMTAELCDPEMSLDVGAIAKGFAVEKIAELLKSEGYTSSVIDAGGNLRAIGKKPDGAPWRTGVKNPLGDGYIEYLDLADGAAVTSGNYERYYTVNGKNYHHIIDKDTLMPSEHFVSVTVTAGGSALADALSTALFNMTYEEGLMVIGELDGVCAIWVTPSGEVKTN